MLKKIVAGIALLAVLVGAGAYFLANREIRTRVDEAIVLALDSGLYEELEYQDLVIEVNGDVRMTGVRVAEPDGTPYVLQEVLISDYDLAHEFPYFMTIDVSGISLPDGLPPVDAFQNSELVAYVENMMVDGVLPVRLQYRYDFDPQDDNALDGSMAFTLPGALAGDFSTSLRRLPLQDMLQADYSSPEQAQMQMLGYMNMMEVPRASFSLTDLGVIEQLMIIGAEDTNMSTEAFRNQMQVQVQSLYFMAPESLQEFAVSAGDQLALFLDGNATLNITAEPSFGGNMQQLQTQIMTAIFSQDFGTIPDLLNLEISVQ